MAQRRAAGFRIHPFAWRSWEGCLVSGQLEAVLDALFAAPDGEVTLKRLDPALPIWRLRGRHGEQTLSVLGEPDATGAWIELLAVHPARMESHGCRTPYLAHVPDPLLGVGGSGRRTADRRH